MGNNFVVYKSNAGSGKTFTLVKELPKTGKIPQGFSTFTHISLPQIAQILTD
jgi:hypothetical protein